MGHMYSVMSSGNYTIIMTSKNAGFIKDYGTGPCVEIKYSTQEQKEIIENILKESVTDKVMAALRLVADEVTITNPLI